MNIDLLMPVKIHWEIADLLHKANYLLASDEHMADVQEIYRKIFKKAAPYAIYENDRVWLTRRGQGGLSP